MGTSDQKSGKKGPALGIAHDAGRRGELSRFGGVASSLRGNPATLRANRAIGCRHLTAGLGQ